MRKHIAIVLIILHVLLLNTTLFAATKPVVMKVSGVKGNVLVANKGQTQGVQKGSQYKIIRKVNNKYQLIGLADVLLCKETKTGLKIKKMANGVTVQNGDFLMEILSSKMANTQVKSQKSATPQNGNELYPVPDDFKESKISGYIAAGFLVVVGGVAAVAASSAASTEPAQ